jgi:hypothetical protein
MADETITATIAALSQEEHELFERGSHGDMTDADRARLRAIEVTLDRCWDLLRQRRAKREFGQDPNEALLRDAKTVEGYRP